MQEEIELGNGLPDIRSTKQVLEALRTAGFEVRFLHGRAFFGAENIDAHSVYSLILSVCVNLSSVRCLKCRSEARVSLNFIDSSPA